MRASAHSMVSFRSQRRHLGHQASAVIEELLRFVAAHPQVEQLQVIRVVPHTRERHLVSPERTFNRNAIDNLWPGPAFRRTQDDHRPHRPLAEAVGSRIVLYLANLLVTVIQRRSELLVHDHGIVAGDENWRMTVATEKADQLFFRNTRVDRRARDLVSVKMKDREYGSISNRVQKLVSLPASFERRGFGFSISDDASYDQIRVIERSAVSMYQRVT